MPELIYLDNQSTTRVDPRVVSAMVDSFEIDYANAGSVTHAAGRHVAELTTHAVGTIADFFHATSDEIVITSGATEANNLALFGVCLHPRQKRRKVVTVATEHRAILDPMERLRTLGFQIDFLPVYPNGSPDAGMIDLNQASRIIDDQTVLVSVMLANNEIGVIQPLKELSRLCQYHGAWLHTDATQAVCHWPIDVDEFGIDLMSFSAHKFYGPKGIGALYVRSRDRRVRLVGQLLGGGQQDNRRSGTLNSPGIIGMAKAIELLMREGKTESERVARLRDLLWNRLHSDADLESWIRLNGPLLCKDNRLPGNLNCEFVGVEGQSLMLLCPRLCISSGSACTSSDQNPSHVLRAIGMSPEQARCSLRFGVGRFNCEEEIETATQMILYAFRVLRDQGK